MTENLNDLRTFLLVAQTQSFTKTAAQLGLSRSAVSHIINQLEQRLNLRLFHRSTRNVSLSDVGERLYQQLLPLFDEIDLKLTKVLTEQNQLQGKLRITGTPHALGYQFWETFCRFSQQYPHIELELNSEIRRIDIVAERFDAGIRSGDMLEKDMIAVKISAEMPMCCVATPSYFARFGVPQHPNDLRHHQCIRLRLPSHGGILDWLFRHPESQEILVQTVSGSLIFSDSTLMEKAMRTGLGLMWIERTAVQAEIEQGRLQSVLDDWAMVYPSYYLYYPHRRVSPLLKELVGWLKGERTV